MLDPIQIIGMSDFIVAALQQLFAAEAEELAKGSVDFQEAAVLRRPFNADRGLVEQLAE